MIEIEYAPAFLNQLKKLPTELQREAIDKITIFKERSNHRKLGVHKLKGRLAGKSFFSVNYSHRIVFKWIKKDVAGILAIGDHEVYK